MQLERIEDVYTGSCDVYTGSQDEYTAIQLATFFIRPSVKITQDIVQEWAVGISQLE